MAATRYRPPHDFGLGGVAIGNEFEFATDEQAEETLAAAWDAGVRYFDVSPWYGLGLAERRFGRFLARKPRGEFVISSKVGKLLRASRDNDAKTYFPFTTSPNTPHFDYSADGVIRSIEDSLQRLGLDRLDIVFVHDLSPDNDYLPDDWEALWPIAEKGAFPALTRLRDEGVIDGWGMGVNCPQPILRCLEVADSDVHLLASQYSLVDHDTAVEDVFPKAREKGVSFVVGSALNAGFLGGAPRFNYGPDNSIIPADKREKLGRLKEVAARHGVDMVAAALQFSLAPDVASSLLVGTAKPLHMLADHAALQAKIPADFWQELRSAGVIHPDAAVPG
ncbi:D-threo-aldose 1-dehydrogenase [Sphingomonas jejuensis]|uniref:D-threo-aldose 1-dehydrogenase n=1 Tax=Sphingomonas jejuensis TaxID=904715 RepID=A0ABX0XKU8_9SPHN|nr:aldo/keto reductase [Sphingomonas jejuensis]NJC33773.1 D-threo-aldose 1-dehydrogenase [Sphingomonas jejuensis]